MGVGLLSESELSHIKTHKYQSAGYSKLDKIMDPFWKKCANYLPQVIYFIQLIVAKS
jgi:hypothetical protein